MVNRRPDQIDTRHAIETPEGVTFFIRTAGPFVRAQAAAIDLTLKMLAIVVVLLFAGVLGSLGVGLGFLGAFGVYWGYSIAFEMFNGGVTPGKGAFDLQVRSAEGTPVTWSGSILRNLLRMVDLLPFAYLAGLVSMTATRRFQRLGDLAAGTIVCYRRDNVLPDEERLPAVESHTPPGRLTIDEQQAIVRFAHRSRHWTRARNRELAEIAEPVTETAAPDEGVERLRGMAATILGGD